MTTLIRMGAVAAIVAALAAGPALADRGGVPHNGGGHANGQSHQDGAENSGKDDEAKEEKGKDGKAESREHKGKSKDSKARELESQHGSSHAKAGKTTICHSTGSQSNPYVTITVSDNALKAHSRHHDGRDIVPAPAGGCPGPTPAAQSPASSTPTSVPAGVLATAPSTAEATAPAAASAPATAGTDAAKDKDATPRQRVLGASASGGDDAAEGATGSLPAEPDTSAGSGSSGLPFTGWDLWLVVALGLAALISGVALRRAGRTSRRF